MDVYGFCLWLKIPGYPRHPIDLIIFDINLPCEKDNSAQLRVAFLCFLKVGFEKQAASKSATFWENAVWRGA